MEEGEHNRKQRFAGDFGAVCGQLLVVVDLSNRSG
jgi:hypothetical protein